MMLSLNTARRSRWTRPGSACNGTGVVAGLAPKEAIRQRRSGLTGGGLGMYLATTSAIWAMVLASRTLSVMPSSA
jgi:hypothetical protein